MGCEKEGVSFSAFVSDGQWRVVTWASTQLHAKGTVVLP